MKIIVPMAGVGKRFLKAGYKLPKPLIEIENKPIIQHVCNLFPSEKDFIFICNRQHLKNTKMSKILKKIKPNCKIVEIDQHKLGPVYTISKALKYIQDNEEVIVSYCDYGTKWNYKNFLNILRKKNCDGGIAAYKGFHPHMLGADNYAFIKEKNNNLLKIKEKKPFTKNRMQEYASNGTYYFKKGAYIKHYFKKLIKGKISVKKEFYVSLIYNLLVKDNLKVHIYQIEKMLQWGTPIDLKEYLKWSNYFLRKKKDIGKYYNFKNHINLMLMAGQGQRFRREGFRTPKPLIQIDNKPMFVRAMQSLPLSKKNFFVCKKEHLIKKNLKKEVKKYFNNSTIIPLNKNTKGQASSCELGLKNIEKSNSVLIGTCDCSIIYDSNKLKKLLDNKKNQIIVFTFKNNLSVATKPNDYSYLKINKNNKVLDVSEKRKISTKPHLDNAIVGIFYFQKINFFLKGLDLIYKKKHTINGEFYIDSIIKLLAKKNIILSCLR